MIAAAITDQSCSRTLKQNSYLICRKCTLWINKQILFVNVNSIQFCNWEGHALVRVYLLIGCGLLLNENVKIIRPE